MIFFKIVKLILKDCFWLLKALLEYASNNITSKMFTESTSQNFDEVENIQLPKRMEGTNFYKYTKINSVNCPAYVFETPVAINETAPKE
jgi:hypothetical protein